MERSVLNEYGVIGSLLLEPSLFPQASGLAAEDFALEPLRVVFRVMRRQYGETGTFDALTVRAETGASCLDVTDELLVIKEKSFTNRYYRCIIYRWYLSSFSWNYVI